MAAREDRPSSLIPFLPVRRGAGHSATALWATAIAIGSSALVATFVLLTSHRSSPAPANVTMTIATGGSCPEPMSAPQESEPTAFHEDCVLPDYCESTSATEAEPTPEPEPAPEPEPTVNDREAEPAPEPTRVVEERSAPSEPVCDDNGRAVSVKCAHGFPAISKDGKRIAVLYSEDEPAIGYPSLHVHILRVPGVSVAKRFPILTFEEAAEFIEKAMDEHDWSESEAVDKAWEQRSPKRIARAQSWLDKRGFEPLEHIASMRPDWLPADAAQPKPDLSVTFAEDGLQIADAATAWVRHQERYDVPANRENIGDEMETDPCAAKSVAQQRVWSTPERAFAFIEIQWLGGPCYCGGESEYNVRQLAEVPALPEQR